MAEVFNASISSGIPFVQRHVKGPKWLPFVIGVGIYTAFLFLNTSLVVSLIFIVFLICSFLWLSIADYNWHVIYGSLPLTFSVYPFLQWFCYCSFLHFSCSLQQLRQLEVIFWSYNYILSFVLSILYVLFYNEKVAMILSSFTFSVFS